MSNKERFVLCDIDEEELEIREEFPDRSSAEDFRQRYILELVAEFEQKDLEKGIEWTPQYRQYLTTELFYRTIVAYDDGCGSLDDIILLHRPFIGFPGPAWLRK